MAERVIPIADQRSRGILPMQPLRLQDGPSALPMSPDGALLDARGRPLHDLRISVTDRPPAWSDRASASTRATSASAITAPGTTWHVSERWCRPTASSPVARSMLRSACGTVEIGLKAARATIGAPLDVPPSMPPAWLEARLRCPSSPRWISSWAAEPSSAAWAKPSPISTPFTDWIDMSAAASRASRRSRAVT